MNQELKKQITNLKQRYLPEGFLILGVFGSWARGEETLQSDIDILYRLTDQFLVTHPGWKSFGRIEEIKMELSGIFGRRSIDLADIDALREAGKKYILPETVYVD